MIVTPTEYLKLVEAHHDKTVYWFPDKPEVWQYKGFVLSREEFNKIYPHPSTVGNGEIDARKEFRIGNPDSTKDWMR